jgi:hypothetical protein
MEPLPALRRKSLLEHFGAIKDDRQRCKVMYRLAEVLLLVVCGTICACDDYDDIVLWGETHLDFLRRLSSFHWGLPCADWLRVVMNRVDPGLFSACFRSFVADRLPGKVDQIAIDGKTSRRSHDRGKGQAALHLVWAYATAHNLVLGQIGTFEKSNEITAIPALLEQLAASGALTGALVSVDAMGEAGPRFRRCAASLERPAEGARPRLPPQLSITVPTIFSLPRTIRRPRALRSNSISTQRQRAKSRQAKLSRRTTAGSRQGPTACPIMSLG